MSGFDDLLRELTAPERQNARQRYTTLSGVVQSVSGRRAVVSMLGGVTRPLRYPAGAPIAVGASVRVAVKGTSAMHIAAVMS